MLLLKTLFCTLLLHAATATPKDEDGAEEVVFKS